MPAWQMLLFPDPRPLVERLGREFFRQLPESAGVYLMRDSANTVLYVGKARNLRKRLTSYRVANPDRMPRRHLRLLRAVARIDLESCADETAALRRESELLLTLRPRFNRAGTWPAQPRFLLWRQAGDTLELCVLQKPEAGWQHVGPMGSIAPFLLAVVARLLWRAANPDLDTTQMPAGWNHGVLETITRIRFRNLFDDAGGLLAQLLAARIEEFITCLDARRSRRAHAFELKALEADLEWLVNCIPLRAFKGESAGHLTVRAD
jgi:predicted GIY-YIG superfamily endonuclease